MKKTVLQTPSIQSLDRGLWILEIVARSSDAVALGQLTEHLGIDRSSVFRLANTLQRRAFLAFFIDDYACTRQVIRVSGQTGEFVPFYCTAHGKALLADYELSDLKSLFGSAQLQARTARAIVSLAGLAKECTGIKADGFAYDDGECVEGVRCLAAPVRDGDGAVVASIGISAPSSRLDEEGVAPAAQEVCRVAAEIGRILCGAAEA